MLKKTENDKVKNKKILILRTAKKADDLTKFLSSKNYDVFNLATHEIIDHPFLRFAKKLNFLTFDAVILTSANAVYSLEKLALAKDKKIFAVGKKTAEAASLLGFKNCEFPQQNCALELAKLIIETYQPSIQNQPKKLLYLRGEEIAFDLRNELASRQIEVAELVVYRKIPNKNFLQKFLKINQKSSIDEILVFSQASLKILSLLLKKHDLSKIVKASQLVCFSKKIADNAAQLGFQNIKTFIQKPFLKKFYELQNSRSNSPKELKTG